VTSLALILEGKTPGHCALTLLKLLLEFCKFGKALDEFLNRFIHFYLELYIAILNDFLCISVLMNFGEIKFMFLSEELKQKFDNLKRPT